MTWWQVWLLMSLGNLKDLVEVFTAVLIFPIAISAIAFMDGDKDNRNTALRILKISATALAISIVLFVAVPTHKQMAAIVATHWAANNKEMQKLPDNVLKNLNQFLEQNLEEVE